MAASSSNDAMVVSTVAVITSTAAAKDASTKIKAVEVWTEGSMINLKT
jgi:hypothetical protein